MQQFCSGLHWHNLAIIGPEQLGYYWEPKGSQMAFAAIERAFQRAAPVGWKLESITLELQADGHSCGDWAHYFRGRVLEYVRCPG